MPAVVPFGFYQGSRSEYLATYILSRLCVVTPVPREGDFGIDLIGHLTRREGGLLEVGEAFSVQVKSEVDRLSYPENPDSDPKMGERVVRWVLTQPIPFFVAVVSKADQRLRLYSTWELLKLSYVYGHAFKQVVLTLGPDSTVPDPRREDEVGIVPLGPPILDVAASDVEDNAKADALAAVLAHWVRLDLENVTNRVAGVCYLKGHKNYTANEMPGSFTDLFYAGGMVSLPGFKKRLATVATVTALTLRDTVDDLSEGLRRAAPLLGALETCESDLDPFGNTPLEQLRTEKRRATRQ
jgi:hypothetical protein